MGYAEGLASGINAGLGINRERQAAQRQVGMAVPRYAQPAPQPSYRQAVLPPNGDSGREVEARYLAKVADERNARLAEGMTSQAADFDFAVQAMQIGNLKGAEDYLKNYGNENLQAQIQRDPNGQIIVTPTTAKGEGWGSLDGGKTKVYADQEDPAPALQPMVFKDTRDFYTKFFGLVKPQKSQVEMTQTQKPEAIKTVEVGAGNGMLTQATLGPDGTVTPIGKPYPQYDPKRGEGGSEGGLTGKPRDYKFWIGEGYSPEEAKGLAFQAVTDRATMAARLLSTARAENAKLFEEERLSDDELQARAFKDADALMERYGSVGGKKAGMAPAPITAADLAPSLSLRPPYNGPVRNGGMAAPTTAAPTAPVIPAPEVSSAPSAAAPAAPQKPAPETVIAQARAAIQSGKSRAAIVARIEQLYPGLSKQL